MTSYFPDVNVWLALNDVGHAHAAPAWAWLLGLPFDSRLIFSRYTQLGLLRLLTSKAVMGPKTLMLSRAWRAYDRWVDDPRVALAPEPTGLDSAFRKHMRPFDEQPATRLIGDCYLLAFAQQSDATLVTFDRALHDYARKQGCLSLIPA
jgi:uncharacterized protein